VESDGSERDGAWVTELTDLIDFDRWPEHTRVIARRERPRPGAQLSLFDTAEGFRHQIFITDQPDRDIAKLELRHRHRAHIENRIRAENSFGHPEQAFRATGSDSSRCPLTATEVYRGLTNKPIGTAANTAKRLSL
jgi:hypothetical protein